MPQRRPCGKNAIFLVNEDQLFEATEKVMAFIPEIKKQYLSDPDKKDGNVQAFKDAFGEHILNALNARHRSPEQSAKGLY